MIPLSILLANEPRAYRDTIAVALRMLRPEINVLVSEPNMLDGGILQHMPEVVICSHLTSLLESRVPTWVVLYPNGALGALLNDNGIRTTLGEMDLQALVDLVDRRNPPA
jgi:hypothetical protein